MEIYTYTVDLIVEGSDDQKIKHSIQIEAKNIIRASAQARRMYLNRFFIHEIDVHLNPTYKLM